MFDAAAERSVCVGASQSVEASRATGGWTVASSVGGGGGTAASTGRAARGAAVPVNRIRDTNAAAATLPRQNCENTVLTLYQKPPDSTRSKVLGPLYSEDCDLRER